jgi:hypothetical protein
LKDHCVYAIIRSAVSFMGSAMNIPQLFQPHPNLSDAINGAVIQSEIEGGVHLRDVPSGAVLEVRTLNHSYTIVHQNSGQALIWGHPEFCPDPVMVTIHGSTWGGTMIKEGYIGRGMRLEFRHPAHIVTTSRIVEVRAKATLSEHELADAIQQSARTSRPAV